MRCVLNPSSIEDYQRFLKIKNLPQYRFAGRTAIFPDEYMREVLGHKKPQEIVKDYSPSDFLFDYQRDIARMAIRKRKFAVFADCGLGKTLIYAEWIRYLDSMLPADKAILWVSPLMVMSQSQEELRRWYGTQLEFEMVSASGLREWLRTGGRFGMTNFEALRDDVEPGRIGALIVDESSMLKSHYGKWGRTILRLGRGLEWKLTGTGTPAPNDRIEYANHAVLMDAFPNINSFLARYFVNRGQTSERWALKPHAIGPFYRALSHWSIFLTNPATYGWRDHAEDIPPIHIHIHRIPLTNEQWNAAHDLTGSLLPGTCAGGIGQRSKLGQIAKGSVNGRELPTNKPKFIRELVDSWPNESTIIWCIYNREQEQMERTFPGAASITGATPYSDRHRLVTDFKEGRRRVLITKPKILGFGLNLQIATRQVFSGLQDSYEQYYQAVKRSNRVGSTRPLNVHIPITEIERPMVQNVLNKAERIQADTEEQERIFKDHAAIQG